MSYRFAISCILAVVIAMGISACASKGGGMMGSKKVTKAGVMIEYDKCAKLDRDVQCEIFITADARDMTIGISSGKSAAFDDAGNKYLPKSIQIANQDATGNPYTPKFTEILADTKTKVVMLFENISTKATEIKRLELDFSFRKPTRSDHNKASLSGNKI